MWKMWHLQETLLARLPIFLRQHVADSFPNTWAKCFISLELWRLRNVQALLYYFIYCVTCNQWIAAVKNIFKKKAWMQSTAECFCSQCTSLFEEKNTSYFKMKQSQHVIIVGSVCLNLSRQRYLRAWDKSSCSLPWTPTEDTETPLILAVMHWQAPLTHLSFEMF